MLLDRDGRPLSGQGLVEEIEQEAGASSQTDGQAVTLAVYDPAAIPEKPPPEYRYYHRPRLIPSLRELWNRREIIYTLAERDIRANYKNSALGITWALLTPILTVLVMSVVFTRVHFFKTGSNIPYPVYAYSGLLCWQFFAGSFGNGSNAVLGNKGLLGKCHFPRECFVFSALAQAALNTGIALIPFAGLMAFHGVVPKIEVLWSPLFMAIEVTFALGLILATSAIVVHVRDVAQIIPMVTTLGLFCTPVIWPFSRIPVKWQPYYSFINPVGPIIDNVRRTMLLGQSPTWNLLGFAALGALTFLVAGYLLFKRLEGDFVDIS